MAAARPIVMASNAANNPVREAEGGVCVAGDDWRAIGLAMTRVLCADIDQRNIWARNAAKYVAAHFDYQVLGERLDVLLRATISAECVWAEGSPDDGNERCVSWR